MDQPTALVLVALIGAAPACLNIYLSRKGREELKAQIDTKSIGLGEKLTAIHEDVNGKVAQLLEATRKGDIEQGHREGVAQERDEERGRKAALPKTPLPVIMKNTAKKPAIVKQVK